MIIQDTKLSVLQKAIYCSEELVYVFCKNGRLLWMMNRLLSVS